MSHVFPRLERPAARQRLLELRKLPPESLADSVLYRHPEAAPVEVGGRPIDEHGLFQLRTDVLADMSAIRAPQGVEPRARFDRVLTQSLQDRLDIVDADTAHEGVWSFLTLMVFPDLAAERWPDMQEPRMLGVQRNALRRLWLRGRVLGELVGAGARPLGEDELVGLFERTALARNRRLVRTVTQAILDWQGDGARSEVVRELAKQVRRLTGPLLLDVLSDEEIHEMVWGVARTVDPGFGAKPPAPAPVKPPSRQEAPPSPPVSPAKMKPTAPPSPAKKSAPKHKAANVAKVAKAAKPADSAPTGEVLVGSERLDIISVYERLWSDAEDLGDGRRLYKGTSTLRPLLDGLCGSPLSDADFRQGRDAVREALRLAGWAVAVDRDLAESASASGRTVRWLLLHPGDD